MMPKYVIHTYVRASCFMPCNHIRIQRIMCINCLFVFLCVIVPPFNPNVSESAQISEAAFLQVNQIQIVYSSQVEHCIYKPESSAGCTEVRMHQAAE